MRTLIVDCYDSYTYNLCQLCQQAGSSPTVIRNDQYTWAQLSQQIHHFDNIILSPGPGSPIFIKDIQICRDIILHATIPILGVCLGHQAIAYLHGATITTAPQVMHGMLSTIHHIETSLFNDIPESFNVVRYHSLIATDIPDTIQVLATTSDSIIMALKVKNKPIWGVQFHPESILSQFGQQIMRNFLNESTIQHLSYHSKVLNLPRLIPNLVTIGPIMNKPPTFHVYEFAPNSSFDFIKYTNTLQITSPKRFLFLDSAKTESTRFSIISILDGPNSHLFSYETVTKTLSINGVPKTRLNTSILHYISSLLDIHSFPSPPTKAEIDYVHETCDCDETALPFEFYGGFIGFLGYESKYETLPNQNLKCIGNDAYPDAAFWFIDRYIIWDALKKVLYLCCIESECVVDSVLNPCEDVNGWMVTMKKGIEAFKNTGRASSLSEETYVQTFSFSPDISLLTTKTEYIENIRNAKALIQKGETYEVCLTTQAVLSPLSQLPSAFTIYKRLRVCNPAPFGSFIVFESLGLSITSSSPELFLKIDEKGKITMKPIKGTVARPLQSGYETLEKWSEEDTRRKFALKNDIKTRAENLMIVDLIRNDLNTISAPNTVAVEKMMSIESYATVHQLVTTVIGTLDDRLNATDAVKNTFPPGSMTGAPKLRTVEILEEMETHPRGAYSGITGYFSLLRPCCQFSVNIRMAVFDQKRDEVKIGAGGAIVSMSDEQDEYDEMVLKYHSVLPSLLA